MLRFEGRDRQGATTINVSKYCGLRSTQALPAVHPPAADVNFEQRQGHLVSESLQGLRPSRGQLTSWFDGVRREAV